MADMITNIMYTTILEYKEIIIAVFFGIFSSVFWLWFWMRERETKRTPFFIILTFFAGAGTALALRYSPIPQYVESFSYLEKIILFAGIEEFAKFFIVFILNFITRPMMPGITRAIDYTLYLVAGALGFAGAENVLYFLNPTINSNIISIIEVGTLRYIGSTVLHGMTAALLGLILGLSFYTTKFIRIISGIIGLLLVTSLHSLFNYFIVDHKSPNALLVLGSLWIMTLLIITLLEKVRNMDKKYIVISAEPQ